MPLAVIETDGGPSMVGIEGRPGPVCKPETFAKAIDHGALQPSMSRQLGVQPCIARADSDARREHRVCALRPIPLGRGHAAGRREVELLVVGDIVGAPGEDGASTVRPVVEVARQFLGELGDSVAVVGQSLPRILTCMFVHSGEVAAFETCAAGEVFLVFRSGISRRVDVWWDGLGRRNPTVAG